MLNDITLSERIINYINNNLDVKCVIEYLYSNSDIKYGILDIKQKIIFKVLYDPCFSKDKLRAIIADLTIENEELKAENEKLKKKTYSNNSESSSIFNGHKPKDQEERKMRDEAAKPETERKPEKEQQITKKVCELVSNGELNNGDTFEGLDVVVEEVDPGNCKSCGTPMKRGGHFEYRGKLCFSRSSIYIKVYKSYIGKCQNPECIEYDELQRTEVEDDTKRCILSTGLTVNFIREKYVMGTPLFTQRFLKLPVTYETLVNSTMRIAERLEPIANLIEANLYKKSAMPYIHIDETYFTVTKPHLKTNGEARSKNYVFVMVNDNTVFYKTNKDMSRSAKWFVDKIAELKDLIYVISDDFSGYEGLSPELHQLCLCHVRRIIYYAVLAIPNKEMIEESKAYQLLLSVNNIFKKEREIKNLTANIKKGIRNSEEYRNLIAKFKKQLLEYKKTAIKGTKLYEAIAYTLDNWNNLWVFRKEGYLECHNTQAELAVKTLAKLRKTSMIFNNPESAKKNCDLLSIVQTALNHNVDVYEYLIYVIHYIDKAPTEDLLPWSDKLFTLPMPKCE